jgi:hypothetical protein
MDNGHGKKMYKTGQAWWQSPAIPATQEVEIKWIMVQGQPEQKAGKIPSQQRNWAWWYTLAIPATQEAYVGEQRTAVPD